MTEDQPHPRASVTQEVSRTGVLVFTVCESNGDLECKELNPATLACHTSPIILPGPFFTHIK